MNIKLLQTVAALLCIALLFASCKKENDGPAPTPVPDYAALKVGNYWVYNTYLNDPWGLSTLTENYDSAYIEKDTMIDGKKYFKKVVVSNIFPSVSFWREENGKLYNNYGTTPPSKEGKISTKVYTSGTDTIGIQNSYLLGGETSISVPAGVYTVKTIEHVFESYSGVPPNRKISIKRWHTKYHATKGDIYRSYAYVNSNVLYEMVLVRTNVE